MKLPARGIAIAAVAALAAWAPVRAGDAVLAPLDGPPGGPPAPWHVVGLPKQSKPFTQFSLAELDGRRVLRVEAVRSYGNLVHPLGHGVGARRLSWRWRVDQPIDASDLRKRSGDDSPVEVCALFDMDLKVVPFVERQVLRVARAASADPVPAASVCYVWDRHFPAGTVLDNAFTRRVRIIVLRGEGSRTKEWSAERRDVAADFVRLFGDESPEVPPLMGISISADADNTQSHSLAYVADMTLE